MKNKFIGHAECQAPESSGVPERSGTLQVALGNEKLTRINGVHKRIQYSSVVSVPSPTGLPKGSPHLWHTGRGENVTDTGDETPVTDTKQMKREKSLR